MVFDLTQLPEQMIVGGAFLAIISLIVLGALKGKHFPVLGTLMAIGVVVSLAGGVLIGAQTASTSGGGGGTPPVSTSQMSVVVSTSPALPSACTLYSTSYYANCNFEYNKTSNAFCLVSSFASSNACKTGANYLLLGFKLIRIDSANTTVAFPNTLNQIPTANSLGSSPQTYSVLGFTAATSTSPGVWQVFPSYGSLANQKPTVTAPSVNSNVETTNCPIGQFGTQTNVWHMSLAGSNSTSAPLTFAEALTNYTAYPVQFTFGNTLAGQGVFTLNLIEVGWTS